MERIDQNQKMLITIVISIYLVSIVISIVTNRFLYADGSLFFVGIINNSKWLWPIFDDSQRMRMFINIVNQFPVVLAIKLGINHIATLRFIYGCSLFCQNILGATVVYYVTKKSKRINIFIFSIAIYSCFNIISEIFIVNQAILSFWVYYIILIYSIVEFKYTFKDKIIIISCLIISTMSHEGIVIFGLLTVIISVWKMIKKSIVHERTTKTIILIATIGQVIFGFWWNMIYSTPDATGVYLEFLKKIVNIREIIQSNLIISIIGLILILIYLKKDINDIILTKLLIIVSIYIIYISYIGHFINPFKEYESRICITIGEIVLFIITFFECEYNISKKLSWNMKSILSITLLILGCQSTWQIGNTIHWHSYVCQFKAGIMNSGENIISSENIKIGDTESRFEWAWNQPTISIAINDGYKIYKIIKPKYSDFYFKLENDGLEIPFCKIDKNVFDYTELLK